MKAAVFREYNKGVAFTKVVKIEDIDITKNKIK